MSMVWSQIVLAIVAGKIPWIAVREISQAWVDFFAIAAGLLKVSGKTVGIEVLSGSPQCGLGGGVMLPQLMDPGGFKALPGVHRPT